MPRKLVIATFNWRNNLLPFRTKTDKKAVKIVLNYLVNNKINICGVQEAIKKNLYECQKELKGNGYTVKGDGRFGKYGKFFPFSISNEQTVVISNLIETEKYETISLPWLGSILPRRVTKCTFGNIVFLNTHLALLNNYIKRNQLEAIYSIINYEVNHNKKVVLTGDFNMTLNNKNFKWFVKKLKLLKIKRIPVDEPTCFQIKSGPIDHIFLPKDWDLLDSRLVDLGISDHKSIVVEVSLKE